MKKLLIVSVMLLSVASAAWAEAERVITTMGSGVVDAVPDMASIDVGVTHQARTAGEALALTSEAVGAVITRLEASGIAERDMQTQGLSLQPLWSRQVSGSDAPRRITGFVASNRLMVRVRELDTLGQILDTVVQDGANTFNGLRFSVQEPDAVIAEARARAVKDAMTKAQQLADAAGVTLGPVQSISENGGGARPVMMEMASARMAADVPVAAGEVSLSSQVSVVFAIADE